MDGDGGEDSSPSKHSVKLMKSEIGELEEVFSLVMVYIICWRGL